MFSSLTSNKYVEVVSESKGTTLTYMSHIKYLEKSFELAAPNLRVNGRNLEDYAENDQGKLASSGFDFTQALIVA